MLEYTYMQILEAPLLWLDETKVKIQDESTPNFNQSTIIKKTL